MEKHKLNNLVILTSKSAVNKELSECTFDLVAYLLRVSVVRCLIILRQCIPLYVL